MLHPNGADTGLSLLFWDASALAKAFSPEAGTPIVLGAIKVTRGRGSVLTEFVVLEAFTVLAKHWRTRNLARHAYKAAIDELSQDYRAAFDVVEVDGPIRQQAFELARRYRGSALGAMDLLHLASALEAARETAAGAAGVRHFGRAAPVRRRRGGAVHLQSRDGPAVEAAHAAVALILLTQKREGAEKGCRALSAPPCLCVI